MPVQWELRRNVRRQLVKNSPEFSRDLEFSTIP